MLNRCQSAADEPGAAALFSEDDVLGMLHAVAATLHSIVSERTEIVIHDLRQLDASVVAIFNGHVSGRGPRDSILAGPTGDCAFDLVKPRPDDSDELATVINNYTTVTRDGRQLQSSTTIIRTPAGLPFAALCLNADLAAARLIQRHMRALLFPASNDAEEKSEPSGTIDQLIEEIIESAVSARGVPVEEMTKAQKIAAVAAMNARGLFLIRRSVERVANRLGTTKFTIYNYLDEIGEARQQGSAA